MKEEDTYLYIYRLIYELMWKDLSHIAEQTMINRKLSLVSSSVFAPPAPATKCDDLFMQKSDLSQQYILHSYYCKAKELYIAFWQAL